MKRNIHPCGIRGFKWEWVFALFLFAWMCMNLVQSVCTEVLSDEAYYYMYGEHLSWGYFDHPPAVGVMTYVSSLLFGGNLGVRFATVILQLGAIVVIWKILSERSPDRGKVVLFFLLTASFVMFQAYGWVTTPDVPLLFFAALFLYGYKRFLESDSLANVLLLAVSMAGMTYSKYHAALIVGLVLLSNLRLLARWKIWAAGLLALLLLVPHFYWQAANDFPSFQYHLSDRSRSFRWIYLLEYLPNQLLVFNPFTFGAAVYVLTKYRPADAFERGLYFLAAGLVIFFWGTAFRGHVEPHWTVVASIPMLVLLYRRSLKDERLMRYVRKWIAPSLLLLLVARVLLTTDGLLPASLSFSGKEKVSRRIERIAGDLPVVFTGSFQASSNYHFHTKKEAFTLSSATGRRTQYDLLEKELGRQGQPVFVCQDNSSKSERYEVDGGVVYGYFVDRLQTVNREEITYTLDRTDALPGDTLWIPFTLRNPTAHAIDLRHPELPVSCRAVYAIGRKKEACMVDCEWVEPLAVIPAQGSVSGQVRTIVPALDAGRYQFALTLVNPICAARNSAYVPFEILRK
ncbi:MAG: glycosyltransferase family 39 protein [Tannerellaceae bacterium]|jgi:hypothetical protein|nr:glycosyltransferase family 39 protein [Tannerellaceae bacterium]